MRSILFVFSWDVIAKALTGAAGIVLIRAMAPADYANYTLAIAGAAIVAQTVAATFNRIYVVGYREFKLQGALSSFVSVQLLLVAALVAITLPFVGLHNALYWCAVLLVLGLCGADMSRTAWQQQLRFGRFALIEVVRAVLFFGGVVTAASLQSGAILAWQAVVVQAAASVVVFAAFLARHLDVRQMLTIREALRLSSRIIGGRYRYLFAYFSVLTLFGQADVFMLKLLGDTRALATYGSAFRYYSLLLLALGAVHSVLLPQVQRLTRIADLRALFARQQRLLFLFLPFVIGLAWASAWFIPFVDKGKYPDAVLVFRVLSVSAAVSFAFSPYVNILLRFEHFEFLLRALLLGLAVSLTLNSFMIPLAGASGAAMTTLLAMASVNVPVFVRARTLLREGSREPDADGEIEPLEQADAWTSAKTHRRRVAR
jgi:O-antigen/teichoic acid export membrane protein